MPDNWFFEQSWRGWNADQAYRSANLPDQALQLRVQAQSTALGKECLRRGPYSIDEYRLIFPDDKPRRALRPFRLKRTGT